jgi:hypothetical protein
VPALIRAPLARDCAPTCGEALFGNVCQGTVYEASAAAVPFLQELLKSADTPDRLRIADLLAEMADGVPSLEAAASSTVMEPLMRDALAREERDFDQELQAGRRFALATRAAIGKELQLLYPYLTCDEPEVRRSVAAALGNFPERAGETIHLLQEAMGAEAEPDAREAMGRAIANLMTVHK